MELEVCSHNKGKKRVNLCGFDRTRTLKEENYYRLIKKVGIILGYSNFFSYLCTIKRIGDIDMISKTETLKLIKEKVDARANGKVKLKKRVETTLEVGIFKHTEKRVFKELFKKGNSIFCVDENYEVHNINELDSTALRTMLWQLITDKEKKEIALEHLYTIMSYLKEL
jgi:hypothetical protein